MNRTSVMNRLSALGMKSLARMYAEFYTNAWQYFLRKDMNAAKRSMIIGYEIVKESYLIAKKHKNNK